MHEKLFSTLNFIHKLQFILFEVLAGLYAPSGSKSQNQAPRSTLHNVENFVIKTVESGKGKMLDQHSIER